MVEVQAIPDGREGIIVHLVVSDGKKALEFYEKAFGAEILGSFPGPDGRLMHAEFQIGDSIMYLADDFPADDLPEMGQSITSSPKALGASSTMIHQYVEDVDAVMQRAEAAGADVVMPAADMFWGDRYGYVQDPFGHIWSFSAHIKDLTEAEMMAARDAMDQN